MPLRSDVLWIANGASSFHPRLMNEDKASIPHATTTMLRGSPLSSPDLLVVPAGQFFQLLAQLHNVNIFDGARGIDLSKMNIFDGERNATDRLYEPKQELLFPFLGCAPHDPVVSVVSSRNYCPPSPSLPCFGSRG